MNFSRPEGLFVMLRTMQKLFGESIGDFIRVSPCKIKGLADPSQDPLSSSLSSCLEQFLVHDLWRDDIKCSVYIVGKVRVP